jgi:hypothetical protein
MNSRLTTTLTILALPLLLAAAGVAADYEIPADRSARQILPNTPMKGTGYRVDDVVPSDGYTDRWSVVSDHGPFEASGDGALRKLLVEINAINELKKTSKTKAFAQGLAGSAKAPVSFVKSLVTHPVDTVSGVPKGAYQVVENVGVSATESKNPAEDSRFAQALKMSSYKRDIAAKLDVDVYSSNKELQKNLNSVAWAATIGDWAFSAAMLPAGVGGSVVSNVRLVNSIKNVLQQEPPQRLRIINNEKLEKMGISEELRQRFLDNQVLTHRHMTIICANLERLENVAGRDAFLAVAMNAQDETQANFYMAMAQVLRGYHETVAPLVALTPHNRVVVAQTKTGQALLALPVDRLMWLDRIDTVSNQLKGQSAPAGFNGKFDVWITGTATPAAKQQLAARGFTVTESVGTRVEVLD